jgi:hypothetical protein
VAQSAFIRRPLTQDQVLSGMRSYSIDYFLPEVKDELVGYFSNDDVAATIDLIGSMRNREFTFVELTKKAVGQRRFTSLDLSSMIAALSNAVQSGISTLAEAGKAILRTTLSSTEIATQRSISKTALLSTEGCGKLSISFDS